MFLSQPALFWRLSERWVWSVIVVANAPAFNQKKNLFFCMNHGPLCDSERPVVFLMLSPKTSRLAFWGLLDAIRNKRRYLQVKRKFIYFDIFS
jgi:hypothetical protein